MSFIETQRLLMRTWLPADREALAEIYGDPLVTAYLPFGVRTVEQTQKAIEKMVADNEREGLALWPVVLKENGTLIGACGLMGARNADTAELGFAFGRAYWGQGYAQEAARATLRLGFDALKKREIRALVRFDNARCIELVNRLGMRFDRVVRERRADLLRYVMYGQEKSP